MPQETTTLILNDILTFIDKMLLPNNFAGDARVALTADIEAITIWLNEYRDSPNTHTSYKQTAERFILWCSMSKINLGTLTNADIQAYQTFLDDPVPRELWCGASRPRHHPSWRPFVKGLSPSSVRLNIQVLNAMYVYLVQSGYLMHNPFSLIKRKSARIVVNKALDRFLTHKEWGYIVEFIEKLPKDNPKLLQAYHRIRWIFNLLYLTGCRRSEIANAKMSDFLLNNNKWWLEVIGKGNKYGRIPVTDDLLNELIIYRNSIGLSDFPKEKTIPLVSQLLNNSKDNNNPKYKGISASMLYKVIKATCSQIASQVKLTNPSAAFMIERVSTHWLRHTSATHQVDAGIDIRVVKENLRHSMLETTMKYQHTESDARHDETSNKFKIK
jgi:site-specific recombinase XerD